MTAIDQAREYEAATDRIYSRGETKAIVRGLLAEIESLETEVRDARLDLQAEMQLREDGPTS